MLLVDRLTRNDLNHEESRKKFGFLEKHKDYVERAKVYHRKEDMLRRLKNKARFRNKDEFYFNMINTRTVDGVHKTEGKANKYTPEELLLMKTQDIGEEATELKSRGSSGGILPASDNIPDRIKRKTAASYRELEARRQRVQDLEKIYTDMAMQKELQKKGKKRKLQEDEITDPTEQHVFKSKSERKR